MDNYAVLIYSTQFGIGSFCSLRNLLYGHNDGPERVPASRLRQLQYKLGPAQMTGANKEAGDGTGES